MSESGIGPGAFVAVVGASGAGKDTLIAAARERADPTWVFPRRWITRPPGPGEDHRACEPAEFADARARGRFALCWHAHGLDYGIPIEVDDAVRQGRTVVANVSRAVLDTVEGRYALAVVVRIVVSDAVRASRLRARGREDAHQVAERLVRADPAPERVGDQVIRNDGTIEQGAATLLGVLARAARPTTSS